MNVASAFVAIFCSEDLLKPARAGTLHHANKNDKQRINNMTKFQKIADRHFKPAQKTVVESFREKEKLRLKRATQTSRLRALRLAKEAADRASVQSKPN